MYNKYPINYSSRIYALENLNYTGCSVSGGVHIAI